MQFVTTSKSEVFIKIRGKSHASILIKSILNFYRILGKEILILMSIIL